MSLLSDEELWALVPNADNLDAARAIQAALIQKLASAELPEPEYYVKSKGRFNVVHKFFYDTVRVDELKQTRYTPDQLRQAYAQGAAAQLSSEPVAARVWVGSYEGADHENQYVYSEDGDGEPLYTRREA